MESQVNMNRFNHETNTILIWEKVKKLSSDDYLCMDCCFPTAVLLCTEIYIYGLFSARALYRINL